jgi:hypothetical protein
MTAKLPRISETDEERKDGAPLLPRFGMASSAVAGYFFSKSDT